MYNIQHISNVQNVHLKATESWIYSRLYSNFMLGQTGTPWRNFLFGINLHSFATNVNVLGLTDVHGKVNRCHSCLRSRGDIPPVSCSKYGHPTTRKNRLRNNASLCHHVVKRNRKPHHTSGIIPSAYITWQETIPPINGACLIT